jgi:threonine synthase
MSLIDLSNPTTASGWKEGIFKGTSPSGGLYLPATINSLPKEFLEDLPNLSITQIAEIIIPHIFHGALSPQTLQTIAQRCFTFPAPLHHFTETVAALELFHGPTYSFKDFGARVMAEVMAEFSNFNDSTLTILTATSGDTGSAVANAFFKKHGFRVVVLYPKGKVSPIQERQFTTLGKNIVSIEVEGTFDDCQALVKQAFLDTQLRQTTPLSSANSINIARLLPQSCYYFWAYGNYMRTGALAVGTPLHVAVPSGNFGNIVAGFIAKKMGLPLGTMIAATNANRTFVDYLQNGKFKPRSSLETISNAMDVGNPNNFPRLLALCNQDIADVRSFFSANAYSDAETFRGMQTLFDSYNYICDPHGAIGYLALIDYLKKAPGHGLFLHTAHPAKFESSVRKVVGTALQIPADLEDLLQKKSHSVKLKNSYNELKDVLKSFA